MRATIHCNDNTTEKGEITQLRKAVRKRIKPTFVDEGTGKDKGNKDIG